MALPEDHVSQKDVFADAGYIFVGMSLGRDLQKIAAQLRVLQHHHGIIGFWDLHTGAEGQEVIQKIGCRGPCTLCIPGSNGKAVHCGPVEARQAQRGCDIRRCHPICRLCGIQFLDALNWQAQVEQNR